MQYRTTVLRLFKPFYVVLTGTVDETKHCLLSLNRKTTCVVGFRTAIAQQRNISGVIISLGVVDFTLKNRTEIDGEIETRFFGL